MKKQKGITLIALIITIIVMLILVGVSVSVALNGGLFKTAKEAADKTKIAVEEELLMDTESYIEAIQNEIEVGTEVSIGEEHFYVIKDEGAKLVLLAKYNLKLDGENWVQDTSGEVNSCAFSAEGNFTAGENLNNNLNVKADTTSAVYKASQYAENTIGKGATGRLMTVDESKLFWDYENYQGTTAYGEFEKLVGVDVGPSFWLSDCYIAFPESSYWAVRYIHSGGLNAQIYKTATLGIGLRPVVEIEQWYASNE